MEPDEKRIRKELEGLFESAKTPEDLLNLKFLINDYIEDGYRIRDCIPKYNKLVQKFYTAFFPSNSL